MIDLLDLNNLVAGSLEMLLAIMIAHRALPNVRTEGLMRAFKFWSLAMALGLLGVGRYADYMTGRELGALAVFGHWFLILYAALRYRHTMSRCGQFKWGVKI